MRWWWRSGHDSQAAKRTNLIAISAYATSAGGQICLKAGRLGGGCARIAHGQHLPLVPIGLVPVHDAATVGCVYLAVHGAVHRAAVRDARRLDAREDGVELRIAHAKAVVDARNGLGPFVEVDGETIVH